MGIKRLLNDGVAAHRAIAELSNGATPRPSASVEYLLEKNRRAANRPTPLSVDLSDRPEGLHVTTHPLSAYVLRQPAPEDSEG